VPGQKSRAQSGRQPLARMPRQAAFGLPYYEIRIQNQIKNIFSDYGQQIA
jgi:hypothetical protein